MVGFVFVVSGQQVMFQDTQQIFDLKSYKFGFNERAVKK